MSGSSFRLETTQKLKSIPAPLLIENAKLLELGLEEFALEIERQLQTNPLLERVEPTEGEGFSLDATPYDEPVGVEHDFAGEPSLISWAETARRTEAEKEDFDAVDMLSRAETLFEHLQRQIGLLDQNEDEKALLTWLAGNLDDEGRLDGTLEAIAASYKTPVARQAWENALAQLQRLDPAGVGARDTTEILLLQLNRLEGQETPERLTLARSLLLVTKDALLRKDIRTIAKALGIAPKTVAEVLLLLSKLNPRPCAKFCDVSNNVLVPDFVVHAYHTTLTLQCKDEGLPAIRFDERTYELLKRAETTGEQMQLWERNAQQARCFVNSIEQRKKTLKRVLQALLLAQSAFFLRGPMALVPLSMAALADTLGLSKSTISRAVANKSIQTPFGTFPLKYFFSASIQVDTPTSDTMSAISVRQRLRKLIEAEDPKRPLSDDALAQKLAAEGIHLARRTIAKYREEEGIGSKTERRHPF